MSDAKAFQSFCSTTLKAREVEDNFVRGWTSKCSSVDRNDL